MHSTITLALALIPAIAGQQEIPAADRATLPQAALFVEAERVSDDAFEGTYTVVESSVPLPDDPEGGPEEGPRGGPRHGFRQTLGLYDVTSGRHLRSTEVDVRVLPGASEPPWRPVAAVGGEVYLLLVTPERKLVGRSFDGEHSHEIEENVDLLLGTGAIHTSEPGHVTVQWSVRDERGDRFGSGQFEVDGPGLFVGSGGFAHDEFVKRRTIGLVHPAEGVGRRGSSSTVGSGTLYLSLDRPQRGLLLEVVLPPDGWTRGPFTVADTADLRHDDLVRRALSFSTNELIRIPCAWTDADGGAERLSVLTLDPRGRLRPAFNAPWTRRADGVLVEHAAGRTLEWIHDVDGDGAPDIVTSAPLADPPTPLVAVSSRTGEILARFEGDEGERVGFDVSTSRDGALVLATGLAHGESRVHVLLAPTREDRTFRPFP